MNKKFLSAILFGALMVTSTGTFVSCKDYDDDIKDLQEQIDKLATKEDMTSQIASLQSALTAAQSEATAAKTTAAQALEKANGIAATATEAEKAAAEAEKAAAQAALDAAAAKEEAIKAAKEEVAKAQEALEKAIATNFEAVKEQLAKQIAELTKKVEEMTGYTTAMLTSLHILNQNGYDAALDLNYARVTANTFVFGKDMAGAFTITKGEINTVADNMLVNVAPVNSVVTSDMLSLVNGKGANLNAYVDVTVADYDAQIMATRAAGNGLRMVTAQLKKDVDFEAFDKLVLEDAWHNSGSADCETKHSYIAYALAVTDAAKARTITSDYNVTIHVVEEDKANVDATLSSSAVNWAKKKIDLYPGKDAVGDEEECFPIILGEDFDLNVLAEKDGHIMASYVIVDMENSSLSVTDKAAISAMNFTGVNQVVKNGIHKISVNGTYATGVAVPMKLVGVDYFGNTSEKSFAVKANKAAEQTASFVLTPAKNVTIEGNTAEAWTPSAEDGDSELQAFTIPATATKYVVELIAGETEHGRDQKNKTNWFVSSVTTQKDATELTIASGIMAGSKSVLKLYQSDKKTPATKNKNVAYAEFVGKLNLQMMKEDKTYTGLVTFYDITGTFLSSNAIEVTKVLPTEVPANFSAKTNNISNGVLTIYPAPAIYNQTSGDKYRAGWYSLNDAFNNWTSDYTISIVDANNAAVAAYNASTTKLEKISSSVIGSSDTYKTTVKYNYGNIKYKAEGHGVVNDLNCTVTWDEVFTTKFGCLPVDSKYEWTVTPEVYYNETTQYIKGLITKNANGVVTDFDNVIKVTNPYGKEVDPFDINDAGWTTWGFSWANTQNGEYPKIILLTGANEVENEFFTATWDVVTEDTFSKNAIKLTRNANDVVLSGDVETTVVLVFNDKFGHEHKHKALTFTMKKDHTTAE